MWLRAMNKLRRALRRYRDDRDLEAVLLQDWAGEPALRDFFSDIEERLHGEEIARLRQKQAEYLALQNQINPHFLYNALEAIRTDALLADCGDIAETTEALATFFRYTISNVQEYVTFSDELDNAENYFTIQRCRFGDKISMKLDMEDEKLLEARMPKLILQRPDAVPAGTGRRRRDTGRAGRASEPAICGGCRRGGRAAAGRHCLAECQQPYPADLRRGLWPPHFQR